MFEVVDVSKLIAFSGIWLAAALTPGANVAFTVSVSTRYGFWAGITGAMGFVTGAVIYSLLVIFGLNLISTWFAPIIEVLRWIGTAYLLWLAWKLWRAPATELETRDITKTSYMKLYLQGLLVCMTNPKAIIFFAVLIPQAIDTALPVLPQFLAVICAGALMSLSAQTLYAGLGHGLGRAIPSPSARVVVNRIIAVIFVIGAVGLATAALPDAV